ncbi:hypothetical protein VNI00_011575 [Paramarasmius palmivorus]|uniref:Fungal-type protein kinase domain-containing protein n=1 Tax=Paramarasmius palmivorus TaxID=297713 RepID=A0AAW0CAB8_9AGAR
MASSNEAENPNPSRFDFQYSPHSPVPRFHDQQRSSTPTAFDNSASSSGTNFEGYGTRNSHDKPIIPPPSHTDIPMTPARPKRTISHPANALLSRSDASFEPGDGSHEASVSNTPYGKGSVDHVDHEKQPRHQDYKPFLIVDVQNEKIVQLDPYLTHVLKTDSITPEDQSALDDIASSPGFQALLGAYTKKMAHEPERYPPFIDLFNTVIQQMKARGLTANSEDIALCIADPVAIRGSRSDRKPDAIGVKAKTLYVRTEQGNAAYEKLKKGKKNGKEKELAIDYDEVYQAARQPPSANSRFIYMWDDILFFIELKMLLKEIKKLAPQPQPQPKPKGKKPSLLQQSSQGVRRSSRLAVQQRPAQSTSVSESRDPGPSRSVDDPLSVASSAAKRSHDVLDAADDSAQVSAKRRKHNESTSDWRLQCASYALEMFNRGAVRTHVIGTLIVDDALQLFLYTRSGSCRTSKFSFVQNPRTFLRILLAFSRMSLADWGIIPQIQPARLVEPSLALGPHIIDHWIFSKQTFVLNGIEYVLEEVYVFPRGLVSRGTWIIRATFKRQSTAIRAVVKVSTPPAPRPTEWSVVDRAVTTANADQQHAWVVNHLPKIYDRGDFDLDLFLSLFEVEKRALRFLVVEELSPITELTDPNEMALVFKDTIEAHQWLVLYPRIMHRDISVNNLMYRRIDGKVYGVLNDFDLACFIDEHSMPTSRQRTGTKPFIAIHLLDFVSSPDGGDKHYVRYDLESFLERKSAIHHTKIGREVNGSKPDRRRVTGSIIRMDTHYGDVQVAAVYAGSPDDSVRRTTDTATYKDAASESQLLGTPELTHPDGRPFEYATLGGHVTYESFLSVFDRVVPGRRSVSPSPSSD